MLSKLTDLVKTAASFLQNGVAPPNTPADQKQELENTNHLSSKKFFLAFSGFVILGVFYASSVAVLILMPKAPELVAAFTTVFSKTIEVFATVMAVYLGSQAIVDLKYNSSSSASVEASVQVVDITNRTVGNEKEDDYELHED
jgi:fructose-1-phosphate kinase PfkB-like protein